MTAYEAAVREVLARLGPGEVVTYGEVAAEAGFPGAPRAVARVLNRHADLPWWRVVNAAGRLVPGNEAEQARRLTAEGVVVVDGARVRMGRARERATGPGGGASGGRAAGVGARAAGRRRGGAPPPPRV